VGRQGCCPGSRASQRGKWERRGGSPHRHGRECEQRVRLKLRCLPNIKLSSVR
jgi:hypothetical protein